jgi:Glycosyltransferase
MIKKYNILISANHCAPGQGSEHGVGWNFVSQLAAYHNITLITNRHTFFDRLCTEAAERGIKVYGIKQYIKFKGLTKLLPFIYYSEYKWWQYRVYKKARQLHREHHFDLIHQVTNITFREPGYLWKLNTPFVWGPVVVLGYNKPKFLNMYGLSEGLKIVLRHIFTNLQFSITTRIKKALNATDACLPVCENTRHLLSKLSPETNFHIMPETASIDEKITDAISKREPEDEIRLLWISRFDPSKGVMFLLDALNKLPTEIKYRLILAGDGPQKNKAIAFCDNKKINYEYLGHLSYDEIQKLYASAHLFFITSMMDATTTVLFEALSNGLPVVALDHLSFGEKISDTCGKKITVGTPEQISHDIADAIKYYYENEDARRAASEGTILQAKANSWNTRISDLCEIYDEIINVDTR